MAVPEDIVSVECGDFAYTVGFERGEVSVDANALRTSIAASTPNGISSTVTPISRPPINA